MLELHTDAPKIANFLSLKMAESFEKSPLPEAKKHPNIQVVE
jgi:hypothetical protein